MIITISDFLEEIKNTALEDIIRKESQIKHRPTIGNIFEGLTHDLLNKALFNGLGIEVVKNSFIINDLGSVSKEMDCIITTNKGRKIKFTNQFKCHIKDVIAVIQVKKNLFAKDIFESNVNLSSINEISNEQVDSDTRKGLKELPNYICELHEIAYSSITGRKYQRPNKKDSNLFNRGLYDVLLQDAYRPLKIVIGYYGYKNEFSLREGFAEEICKAINREKSKYFTPWKLPNIYICGGDSIVKNNGMPYGFLVDEKRKNWGILATSHRNPFYHLLEIIWTRLASQFKLNKCIWDNSYNLEELSPFISCSLGQKNGKVGWNLNYERLNQISLNRNLLQKKRDKIKISKFQYYLLMYLMNGNLSNYSQSFVELRSQLNDKQLEQELNDLKRFHFIYQDGNHYGIKNDNIIVEIIEDIHYAYNPL